MLLRVWKHFTIAKVLYLGFILPTLFGRDDVTFDRCQMRI